MSRCFMCVLTGNLLMSRVIFAVVKTEYFSDECQIRDIMRPMKHNLSLLLLSCRKRLRTGCYLDFYDKVKSL